MKKKIICTVSLFIIATMFGCTKFNVAMPISTSNNIFSCEENKKVEKYTSYVDINFSLKHLVSRFFNYYKKHENPELIVYLDIDGQVAELKSIPLFEDKNLNNINNDEIGNGWRYNFNKRILINNGIHKIKIIIPSDDYLFEKIINIKEGYNRMKITPVYKINSSQRPFKKVNFVGGIKDIEIAIE